MLAWREGRFVVPVLNFCACTHAREHTRLFLLRQACTTHIHLQLRRGCGGRSVQLPCSRACIPLPPATVPLGHHPRLVRIARNSAVPQKWYKHIIYLHFSCRCTVGRFWLRTPPAVLGSSELRSSELSSADRLLVGVRAPRRCPLAQPRHLKL